MADELRARVHREAFERADVTVPSSVDWRPLRFGDVLQPPMDEAMAARENMYGASPALLLQATTTSHAGDGSAF